MKVVKTYQQALVTSAAATYAWDFTLARYMKSNPSNHFIVKLSSTHISTTATITTPLLLYMYHPSLCGGTNTQVLTSASATTTYNKLLVAPYYTSNNNLDANNQITLLCDEMPLTPIQLNVEYSGTGLAPTSGNVFISVTLAIYEVEGDIESF
jgi:hypothetical protein